MNLKIVKRIANIISLVFNPLFIPTYSMILVFFTSYLVLVPLATRWITVGIVFALTGLLPLGVIMMLKRMGLVSDIDLTDRTQRTIPYVTIGVCFLVCSIFLSRIHCPELLVNMLQGAAVAVIIMVVVNHWWKISAHGAGTGAWTALVVLEAAKMPTVVDMMPIIVAVVLLSGITCTSRIILGKHTPMQVVAGWSVGALCVWLMTLI